MLIKNTTEKSVADTGVALNAAVVANHFGVLQEHDMRDSMTRHGVEFTKELLIFEVCQPAQAKRVLDEDMSVSTALPCRISIYEENGKTVLVAIKPTLLLELFHTPGLGEVAQEVENAMIKIMQEAADSDGGKRLISPD